LWTSCRILTMMKSITTTARKLTNNCRNRP
jgi:hypothetical protein